MATEAVGFDMSSKEKFWLIVCIILSAVVSLAVLWSVLWLISEVL